MRVRSLGREESLEEEMATHSSIFTGKSQGQRSLAGHSLWVHKESDTTERLSTRAAENAGTISHLHRRQLQAEETKGFERGCSAVSWRWRLSIRLLARKPSLQSVPLTPSSEFLTQVKSVPPARHLPCNLYYLFSCSMDIRRSF